LTVAQEEYIKDMRHMDYMRMMAEKENEMAKQDMVNHPKHYNESGIECIDALEAVLGDGFSSYLQGNIIKYMWRFRYKNGKEDLKKAQWYLNKLIEVHDDKS
jgi:hypothetical protein|tara:strand:- start:149 stop:454 length:306 start_codon:yes stop_codon:yes gene_type:complete